MKKTLLLTIAGALLLAPAAAAHVTANPAQAAADSYAMIAFRVPHGCEDSATTSLTVQIPEGVESVTPQAVPGWEAAVADGGKEVTWTGGPLAAHQFTDFGISMKLPNTPGERLAFPAIQRCEQGETRWIQIPVEGEAEPDTPAPVVELTAATGGHGTASSSAEEPASSGGEEAAAAAASTDEGEDDDAVLWVAVGLGAAGLVAGLAALGVVFFRRPRAA
jgi:uncharacterized protein YcnI